MAIPMSIRQFVEKSGVAFTPIHHRPAFTAQQEAAATHVPGRAWAKTVVCVVDGRPILAMLPAHYMLDLEAVRDMLGAREVRLATEHEIAAFYPDCETGAMAPFGPLYGQPVYMEEALARDPEITFHAGTHVDAMRMRFSDFVRLVKPIPARITLRSH
jgi:Ala-tRNA(Pro) deacylase